MNWTLTHFPCASIADFHQWNPEIASDEPVHPANVPGSVQTSRFGLPVAELLVRGNWARVAWMESRLWVYRAEFETAALPPDCAWLLRFGGLDYRVRIFVDGSFVADHEGMFSPVELELPPSSGRHVVHLAFLPPLLIGAPFGPGQEHDLVENLKARYMKGWDFCPRLLCVGPWDDVSLEVRPRIRIADVAVVTRLDNAARADVAVTVHFNRWPGRGALRIELGGEVVEIPTGDRLRHTLVVQVKNPVLWWPCTHGAAHRYSLRVSHRTADGTQGDSVERLVGLRSVRRAPASGQSPVDTPLQWEINNAPVFLNGMNLTPFNSVPAEVSPADYARILGPMREAGVNVVRVWGGGLREKAAFYDWCDAHGMMVLQEFPLACQAIARSPGWLDLLEREARSIARALASHPCVIGWTGGNEHYHFWEAVDSGTPLMNNIKDEVRRLFSLRDGDRSWRGGEPSDHPALRLLEGVSREENPASPYDITSALEDQGDVHGPWNLRLPIGDHRFRDAEFFSHWRGARAHLFSECAVSAAAHPGTVAQILGVPTAELSRLPLPSKNDPRWVAHKAFRAVWDAHEDLWLDIPETERYFGPLANLGDLLFANHYLQCEAARFMVETLRQRQGHVTGLIWWGANEPYPGLAGCALVDYYGRVKPALRVLASAFAPRLLSLDYERCVLRKFHGGLVFTNSLPDCFRGRYRATLSWTDASEPFDSLDGLIDAAAYSVVRLPGLMPITLRADAPLLVHLELFDEQGALVATKCYRFFADVPAAPLSPLLPLSAKPVETFFL